MSSRLAVAVCATALVAAAATTQQRVQQRLQQAAPRREMHVVELSGTPYERGLQHGETLRAAIAEMLAHWRRDVRKATGREADDFVARFLAATHFDDAARRHTPELLDEVRGIAAGAGQPFATMFCYQLIDELWALGHTVATDKCSTVGVDRTGDAPAFVAQNLDLPQWMHAHPTLLRIRDASRRGAAGALESLVVTLPGLVGGNGVNNHRVAVGVNTILSLRPSSDGLPVAFVVRGLLACTSYADALQFLRDVPHASGQAYTVGGSDTAPCFEASAGGVVPWQPAGRNGWRWHTNSAEVSRDWAPHRVALAAARGSASERAPTCPRFAALDRALPEGRWPDVEQVVTALCESAAAPVCNDMTYCCTVMVLGERPELRVACGRPDQNAFVTFDFAK
ncbi:MAG: C45 family peptidase [Planctomycetota bacterium]